MKDFLCVKFLDSNTNDIVSKYWMKGSKKNVFGLLKVLKTSSLSLKTNDRLELIGKNILAKFCAKRVRYKKSKITKAVC